MSKQYQPTVFENAHLVTGITAHYTTPGKFISRTKSFQDVKSYLRWERSVERMDYNITCVDTDRKEPEMITVTNLMSGKQVEIPADTPWSCRVDSETYWCS